MSQIFREQAPGPPFKGKRREGAKRGREGRKGERMEWEGSNPKIKFHD
jgi:hypothetical protein